MSIVTSIAVLIASCTGTSKTADVPTVNTHIAEIDKYGNCALAVPESEFSAYGYAPGDLTTVTVGTVTFDAPVGTNYSDVDNGSFLIRVNGDTVSIAINMGNFSRTSGGETGTPVTITLKEKAGYLQQYEVRQLKRSESRDDYVSDEVFANFRAVSAGKIAENRLYRSCNPVLADARGPYAAGLVEAARIKTVLNLADSEESAVLSQAPYYASLAADDAVVFLNMGVSFTDPDFIAKLYDGLVFLSQHPTGPYLVHCNEGKDRAGFVSALLEALNGATLAEMTADYMLSFENYYGVQKDTEQYTAIGQTIPKMFTQLNDGKRVTDKNVAHVAERYVLQTVGISPAQLAAIRNALQQP